MAIEVLWIDDQYQDQDTFISDAELSGIDITPAESHEEGMRELEADLEKYDAVILDAKVKLKADDETPSIEGLRASRDRLLELRSERYIPFFIFTGQPDYQSSSIFNKNYKDAYYKNEDNEKLFNDIKAAVKDRPNAIIRYRYKEVFELFTDKFLGREQEKHILKILRSINEEHVNFDDELYFNRLRIILEHLFRAANEYGLLHDNCIQGKSRSVLISWSNRFLSGKSVDDLGIICSKKHFPELIQDHVNHIIEITNIASHSESVDKAKSEKNLSEYRKIVNTPYLLYSLTFKLLDVLIWFKNYVTKNNNYEENKALWEEIDDSEVGFWLQGTIINVNDGGFAFLEAENKKEYPDNCFIPESTMSFYDLDEGDRINGYAEPSDKNPIIKKVEIIK